MKLPLLGVGVSCENREAWLAERSKSIGASDASAVLGMSPFRSPLDVYAEKVSAMDCVDAGLQIPAFEESEPMEWGNALEEPIARMFAKRNPQFVVKTPPPFSICHGTASEILHATPDRFLIRDEPPLRGVLEIKTTSAFNRDDWEDEVPKHIQVQIQQQMLVLDLAWGFVTVLIGGQEMKSFGVAADAEFHRILIEEAERFWSEHVLKRRPPAPSGPRDAEAVRSMFPRASVKKTILLPAHVAAAYDDVERYRAEENSAKDANFFAQSILQLALGDAEMGVLPDGRRVKWANEDALIPAKPEHTIQKRFLRLMKPEHKEDRWQPEEK